jgi:hypothetical protein
MWYPAVSRARYGVAGSISNARVVYYGFLFWVFNVIIGRIRKLPNDGNSAYALVVFTRTPSYIFYSTALSDPSAD